MSNLTVSYVSQTAAAPAAGGPAVAPTAANPLGFLAALIDQLLAGDANVAKAGMTADAGAGTGLPSLLGAALEGRTADASSASPNPLDVLSAKLNDLAAGDSEALPAIGGMVDALLTDLDTSGTSSADLTALRDRLAALRQSLSATAPDLSQNVQTLLDKLDAEPDLAATDATDPDTIAVSQVLRMLLGHAAADNAPGRAQQQDDLQRALATLGVDVASAASPAGADVTATGGVPAPLLRLSNQLTQVATGIEATRPELAAKLEAVATRLVSAGAGPDLLAQLNGAAAEPDGVALDKLVQSLIDAKPATALPTATATPELAAPRELSAPAPTPAKQSTSTVADARLTSPDRAPTTAESVPQPHRAAKVATKAAVSDPRIETKAAAVIADVAKADPVDSQPPPQQGQQPVPIAAQQSRTLPAAYQVAANPINMGQVAFEMVRQVHQGTSRFTIRLDPPELGRIDVKMHVDPSGALNARLTVDRAETLDLFQRDQRSLERALAQAGLDAGKTNLEFSLRQQNHNPFAGMMGGDQRQQQGYGTSPRLVRASGDDTTPLPAITLYRGLASAGGVNIFA